MESNWPTVFSFMLRQEGGPQLSMASDDPGNWSLGYVGGGVLVGSKYGVSAPRLAATIHLNSTSGPITSGLSTNLAQAMVDLTERQAEDIYLYFYWRPIHGPLLPKGLDLLVFDSAVNQGVVGSGLALQKVINQSSGPTVTEDGIIGLLTLHALTNAIGLLGLPTIIARTSIAQLRSYMGDAGWHLNGRGWGGRLGRRLSEAMALAAQSLESTIP
jgi:lysozyme family protein